MNKPKQTGIEPKNVPCNGCTLCCQGDIIKLEPDDLAGGYQIEPHPRIPGALMLTHKPNGDCIYLEEHGCSIHGHAPSLCRIADCRTVALKIDFDRAMALHRAGTLDIRVWDHGWKLIESMRKQNANQKGDRTKEERCT